MRDLVTTVLDVLGLVGLAAGIYFAAEPWIGGAALIPASLLVLGASALWAVQNRARESEKR